MNNLEQENTTLNDIISLSLKASGFTKKNFYKQFSKADRVEFSKFIKEYSAHVYTFAIDGVEDPDDEEDEFLNGLSELIINELQKSLKKPIKKHKEDK